MLYLLHTQARADESLHMETCDSTISLLDVAQVIMPAGGESKP